MIDSPIQDSDGSSIFEFPAYFDQLTQLRELYIYAPLAHFPMSICRLPNLRAFIFSDLSLGQMNGVVLQKIKSMPL